MFRISLTCCILFLFFACGNNEDSVQTEAKETVKKTENTSSNVDSAALTEALPAVTVKGKKGKVLLSCIGNYQLTAIEASVGANGMFDYIKESGVWSATGSAISDGMRESYTINLDKKNISELNGLSIEIDNNLNVRVFVNEEPIIEIPYSENQLLFELKNNGKDYIPLPEKLERTTTFSGFYLYLMASDRLTNRKMNKLDLLDLNTDVALLRYNQKEAQFELNLFQGECCDNSLYIFKK